MIHFSKREGGKGEGLTTTVSLRKQVIICVMHEATSSPHTKDGQSTFHTMSQRGVTRS